MSQTRTASATYTIADIEKVIRKVKADLIMIADSTGGWSAQQASNYAHDVEVLAKAGYLMYADVTLFGNGNGNEIMATRFEIDTEAGGLTTSRPGGVLWPRVHNPFLRIILRYTNTYTVVARAIIKHQLRVDWSPSNADTSHSTLISAGGRDYASNAYGVQRKDWAA